MTNAATGHAITGRHKGWRKAVRYALTENPVSDIHTEWREPKRLYLTAEEGKENGRAPRRGFVHNRHGSVAVVLGAA
jgi:hypothetical protein